MTYNRCDAYTAKATSRYRGGNSYVSAVRAAKSRGEAKIQTKK